MSVKYFYDNATGSIELIDPHGLANAKFESAFPGIKGRRYDSFSRLVGTLNREVFPVTRVINYKSQPSKHQCDARCVHAKGRTMNCECSCGGANHGKGA